LQQLPYKDMVRSGLDLRFTFILSAKNICSRFHMSPSICKGALVASLAVIGLVMLVAKPCASDSLSTDSTSLGELHGFWKTEPMTDQWLDTTAGSYYRCCTHPFTDTIATVRILGGWVPSIPGGAANDLAYRDSTGALRYRWNLLKARIDPVLANGMQPLVVLDNVPYAFVSHPRIGVYGQIMGPDHPKEYGRFIEALCQQLVTFYGFEKTNEWKFRVLTEPNEPGHWGDTDAKYVAMYDYVVEAVKSVLPGATIGPGNFATESKAVRDKAKTLLTKIIYDFNPATEEYGARVDYLSDSAYATYNKGTYQPETWANDLKFLESLRSISPRLTGIPLQVLEFGMYENERNQLTDEPGAYGAAWTAQALFLGFAQMRNGLQRIAHWGAYDTYNLLEGEGWLLHRLEPMNGGKAFLLAPVTEGTDDPGTNVQAVGVVNTGKSYVVISSFNIDRNDHTVENVSIDVSNIVPSHQQYGAVQYVLTQSNSVEDIIYDDLAANGLLQNPDLLIGEINSVATPAGLAFIEQNLDRYRAIEKASLEAQSFSGQITTHSAQTVMKSSVQTPGVEIIELQPR
jgi:hypothetical protein